jgi:site-specific DNA-methyltransferase (adenine-specific)
MGTDELPINTIICGDNCEVMRQMPSESIDLVVTSPPYDDLRTYGGHSWDFYGVAWNLKRLLKPGGVIVWIVNDATKDGSETGSSMRQALHFQSIGLNIHDTMVWHKINAMPLNASRYEPAWEYMFVVSKGRPKTFNAIRDKSLLAGKTNGGTQIKADGVRRPKYGNGKPYNETKVKQNIWPTSVGGSSGDHPAVFPEVLARDHIVTWSNEGDIVLDPFSGSGTTAKMAKHNGRRWIGIEINTEYVEIANKRLEQGVLF